MEPTNPNRVHSGFRSMKVVGICGSPRKGNTEWMLGKLLEEVARSGIDGRASYGLRYDWRSPAATMAGGKEG
jgi:hypothetical protein